ncbi:MAG: LysR family transcriptional regulator [Betaproteobacteria bacterium]|nr:LysR family transcriptional regulator [Betaproteobacteria bacterium]
MELRDLEYFRVVARHGHIGRAAETLKLTQPALSKSVARLEASVGARLLERTPRGVVLTQVGIALIARATHIHTAVDGALREAKDLSSGASGQLRIGTGPTAGEHILPAVCAELLRGSPRLFIQVVVGLSDVLLAALERGELDLVFGSFPEPRIAGMTYESLGEDVLTVFTRKRHALARARQIDLSQLAGVRWALPNASVTSRRTLQHAFQTSRLPAPDVALESNSTQVLLAAVARSDMVGYLPTGAVRASGAMRELALLDVAPLRIERSLGVISRPGAYLPPVAARLMNALRRVAAKSVE